MRVGPAVVRLWEVVNDIPAPDPETDLESTVWQGLGYLTLKASQDQQSPEAKEDPLASLTAEDRELAETIIRQREPIKKTAGTLGLNGWAVGRRLSEVYSALDIDGQDELARIVPVAATDYENVSIDTLNELTISQVEVLGHVILGKDNGSIANQLGIPNPRGVEDRLKIIKKRFGIKRRLDAYRAGTLLKDMAKQTLLEMIRPDSEPLHKTEVIKMRFSTLTEQEARVISLAAQDKTREEIAAEMGVKLKAIRDHWWSIKKRLDIKTTEEAIGVLHEPKILSLEDFYDLDILQRKTLIDLSRGILPRDADEVSKSAAEWRLTSLKTTLSIRTTPILNLVAQANKAVIQAGEVSAYHKAGLIPQQIKAIRFSMRGQTYSEIGSALNVNKSTAGRHVLKALDKLGLENKDVFEASLELEPPGFELIEDLDLHGLEPIEQKIFLKMANNPTNSELRKEIGRAESVINRAMSRLMFKLGMRKRMKVARASYAHHQEAGREYPEESFLPFMSRIVDRLVKASEAGTQARLPIATTEILEKAGLGYDSLLVDKGRGKLVRLVTAELLESEQAHNILDTKLRQGALYLIDSVIYDHQARLESVK